jgi:hypothetical protein
MKLSKAQEILERELRSSHLQVIVVDKERVELRGHLKNEKITGAFIFYGLAPLIGAIYFWKKEQVISLLCLALGLIVVALKVGGRSNTKSGFLLIDKRDDRLHYFNAGEEHVQEGLEDIQSVSSMVYEIHTKAMHSSYMGQVHLRTAEGHKLIVAQFEDTTDYGPIKQARALGQFLGAFLDKPFEHISEVRTV